jgi:hypothetical protein
LSWGWRSPERTTRSRELETLGEHVRLDRRILRLISDSTALPEIATSERLARRWFALVQHRAFEQLTELVHEDIRLVSKVQAGTVVEGRADAAAFIQGPVATSLYEAVTDIYTPLDDDRVIVEGRIRWIDDERVIRDDPVVWAMEFRDGLLLTFVPTRTTIEAETILASPR